MAKNKNKQKKIVYYNDPLNDDFAGTNINQKTVDHNFKIVHRNPVWRFFALIIYYLIAVPIVWIWQVVFSRIKFVNKKAIKKLKKPVFLYGNHSHIRDIFTANIVGLPKRTQIIASPDAVSIKGLKNIVQMLGAIPTPTDMSGMKKFTKAIEYYYNKGNNIAIYPEAHIWPYYTGVRPFIDSSFGYPVSLNAPVVAFFTAYSKPTGLFKHCRKANLTVYISDPFYPDQNLSKKEAKKDLRDKVYNFMLECSQKYSSYAVIEYKHISECSKHNQKNAN